jgi:ubiquinone/menaquinone biosynthesis C-methylase UbiE
MIRSVLSSEAMTGWRTNTLVLKGHRNGTELAHQNVPAGRFVHGDAGSVAFPPNAFVAVVSFYTLEHVPRQEHETVLGRIYRWLRPGGFLLIGIEGGIWTP